MVPNLGYQTTWRHIPEDSILRHIHCMRKEKRQQGFRVLMNRKILRHISNNPDCQVSLSYCPYRVKIPVQLSRKRGSIVLHALNISHFHGNEYKIYRLLDMTPCSLLLYCRRLGNYHQIFIQYEYEGRKLFRIYLIIISNLFHIPKAIIII
jgi:hypothetical protein